MLRVLIAQDTDLPVEALRAVGLELQVCQGDARTVLHLLRQPFAAVVLPGTDGFACLPTQYRLERQAAPETLLRLRPEPVFAAVLSAPDPHRRALLEQVGFDLVMAQPLSAVAAAQQLYGAVSEAREQYCRRERELRAQVRDLLCREGCPARLKGFAGLCECLLYLAAQPDALYQATKVLYPQVAARMGTSAANLERSMRTALARMRGETHPCVTAFLSQMLRQLEQQERRFRA